MRQLLLSVLALLLSACAPVRPDGPPAAAPAAQQAVGQPAASQPMAVAYRTNGDWADRVVVAMNADRTALLSYPDVADVGPGSAPLPLAGGWLLDRRGGVSTSTAFLSWTYAEYSALGATPTVADVSAHILPDARVVEVRTLPIPLAVALADTASANALLPRPPALLPAP